LKYISTNIKNEHKKKLENFEISLKKRSFSEKRAKSPFKKPWDNFTKGPDSPHINAKFFVNKTEENYKQFVNLTNKKNLYENNMEVEGDVFSQAKNLYNSLDESCNNSVKISKILRILPEFSLILSEFNIANIEEFKRTIYQMQVINENFVTWSEFIDALFTHKQSKN